MKKNNKGFTMAELLIVVAITVVLMGVAFIAVPSYQRSSTRLEYDGIAKEIFIAAQNHLTTAQSQGYLQLSADKYGAAGTHGSDNADKAYIVSKDILNASEMLDLMLPFGAIDETVRASGTFIIRYQPSSGRVLDVFYSLPGRSSMLTVSGVTLDNTDYEILMSVYKGEDKTKEREHFENNGKTGVVGWYGGGDTLPIGSILDDPTFTVHNEEVLWVSVSDPNEGKNASLQLKFTGEVSGAEMVFILRKDSTEYSSLGGGRISWVTTKDNKRECHIIVDDITKAELHFNDLNSIPNDPYTMRKGTFQPGENLVFEAIAYNDNALTNIANSGRKTENSLFSETVEEENALGAKEQIINISNFRHFENLDNTISSFDGSLEKVSTSTTEVIEFKKARQLSDLVWTEEQTTTPEQKPDSFIEAVAYIKDVKPVSIFGKNNSAVTTGSCFYPVSPNYLAEYEGKSNDYPHKVSNVKANHSSHAGLFGSIENSEIRNLELIDFEITTSSGNAGALIGTATGTTVTNVLAYHTEKTDAYKTPSVTASNGSAGGLIGSAASSIVNKSAAALVVNGSENAGGLIGASSGDRVTASYAGGHTIPVTEGDVKRIGYSSQYYNVTGATSGGLVGNAGNTEIDMCYSTCSVSGPIAGGFVGTASGTIKDSYCTGLVNINDEMNNAFIGSGSPTFEGQNYYYEIINEVITKDGTGNITNIAYKGSGTTSENVKALDESVETYNSFSGNRNTDWKDALPYNSDLSTLYGKSETDSRESFYNLKTVERLGARLDEDESEKATDFVATHYGDWPVPEIFFINEGTSSS